MKDFKTICETIDKYETASLAEDWSINFLSEFKGVLFSEIVEDCKRYGLTADSLNTKRELLARIDNWATFGLGDKPDREKLHTVFDVEKIVDDELGTNLCTMDFGSKTPDQIADRWEEEERWEKEEEERQKCIDWCANFIYADGLVDTLDDAYDLAESVQ